MPLNEAVAVAKKRNSWTAWKALRNSLAEEYSRLGERDVETDFPSLEEEELSLPGGRRTLTHYREQMARTGSYDTSRYRSPSEARQSILAAAVAAGWSLTDVQRRMHQATWIGLKGFYARYGSRQMVKALRRDWRSAVAYVQRERKKRQGSSPGENSVRKSHTSQPNTHPPVGTLLFPPGSPEEFRYLRTWRNALALWEESLTVRRPDLHARILLRALGESASKTGSRYIEFGVRSLALAAGVHETTVARQLRRLALEENSLIRLAGEAHGTKADVYELVIPVSLHERAAARRWQGGKLHALRPAFRALGVPAALTYEALEYLDEPAGSRAVAERAGLSSSAAAEALLILAGWGLAERGTGGWSIRREVSLEALAEVLGVGLAVGAQQARYRRERGLWHRWLDARAAAGILHTVGDGDEHPPWALEPPDPLDYEPLSALLPA